MHRYCNSKHSGVFGIYELFDFLINFNSLPKDNVRKARKECQNILDNPRHSQTVRVSKLDYPCSVSCTNTFPAFTNRQEQSIANLPGLFSHLPTQPRSQGRVGLVEGQVGQLGCMEPEDFCIREPDLVIETDASRQGWGASCMGVATGVRWTSQEKSLPINCLELLVGQKLAMPGLWIGTTSKVMHSLHFH